MKFYKWNFLSNFEKLILIFDQGYPDAWECVCICNWKYLNKDFTFCSVVHYFFLEGAQISKCEDAELYVDRSFKYFKIKLSSNAEQVVVKVEDIKG